MLDVKGRESLNILALSFRMGAPEEVVKVRRSASWRTQTGFAYSGSTVTVCESSTGGKLRCSYVRLAVFACPD
jgi:hypothetical protein